MAYLHLALVAMLILSSAFSGFGSDI